MAASITTHFWFSVFDPTYHTREEAERNAGPEDHVREVPLDDDE